MKLHDILLLLGVLFVLIGCFIVDLLLGVFVTGFSLIFLSFIVAKSESKEPDKTET